MTDRFLPTERRCPTVIFMNGRDWQCARIDGHEPDDFQPDTDWSTIGRGCRTFTQPDPGALDAWWRMHHTTGPDTAPATSEPETDQNLSGAWTSADDELSRERVLEDA